MSPVRSDYRNSPGPTLLTAVNRVTTANKPQANSRDAVPDLFGYRKYWAQRFGIAPFLPMSRAEMDVLGWDSCDVIVVTGDAYIDHASFGMAIIGRLLEAQGFRVGIISQPDWHSSTDFAVLGAPNLFFGITSGNMDSMVNRYTADKRVRSDDAYTAHGAPHKRPDRALIVYAQRAREAFPTVPIIAGGIEASLRRIAHYDYWSEQVRRSVLFDTKADLLVYGNGERAIVEIAHRLARGEQVASIQNVRGTAFACKRLPPGTRLLDSTSIDAPGPLNTAVDPYAMEPAKPALDQPIAHAADSAPDPRGSTATGAPLNSTVGLAPDESVVRLVPAGAARADANVVRLPDYETVRDDPVLYAHASRVLHLESNPGNARALVQRHGDRELYITPPPVPLTMKEMDSVYELPYQRIPHPAYGNARIPAYEMIRFSITIQRGCFGGCSFCSITEHEGRIIQNRSEDSIVREIEAVRDHTPGFTGVISDLGGPTANMYRLQCKSRAIETSCRRLSCVFPTICKNLKTDHAPLIHLYRRARALPGIKKVLIGSGVRYDLAVQSPEYVKELVTHHVGGYLKIAPEHTEEGPLGKMMKPGMESYHRFKELFDRFSAEAGKEQYLIPYFIAAHPGTTDQDMLQLAVWLKTNGFRADQVQAFLPSPMSMATAMYHSGKNPIRRVARDSESLYIPRGLKQRRLHKAFLRYHDANNWPLLREALKRMGREDLIGNSKRHLVPLWQPAGTGAVREGQRIATQHTGAESRRPAARPRGAPRR